MRFWSFKKNHRKKVFFCLVVSGPTKKTKHVCLPLRNILFRVANPTYLLLAVISDYIKKYKIVKKANKDFIYYIFISYNMHICMYELGNLHPFVSLFYLEVYFGKANEVGSGRWFHSSTGCFIKKNILHVQKV